MYTYNICDYMILRCALIHDDDIHARVELFNHINMNKILRKLIVAR